MHYTPLTFDHCQQWADLLAISFRRTPIEMRALLSWLHDGYPIIAWGAWDGERLVAQYSCRVVDLHLPGCKRLAKIGMSINMAVHPAYRGQGLVKRLARPVYMTVAEMGGIAGVGFSNAEGVKVDLKSKSYGYRVVGRMFSTLVWLNRRYPKPLTLLDDWPDNHDLSEILRSSSNTIHFAPSLNALHRRFACHPFRRYQFGLWTNRSKVRGLVIYRPVKFGLVPRAALLAAYSDDLPELLGRWAGAIRQVGIYIVHTLVSPSAQVRDVLHDIGLSMDWPYSRTPYYLTARPVGEPTPSQLFDYTQWDRMGGMCCRICRD